MISQLIMMELVQCTVAFQKSKSLESHALQDESDSETSTEADDKDEEDEDDDGEKNEDVKCSDRKIYRSTRLRQKRKLHFKFPISALSKSKRMKFDVKSESSTSQSNDRTKKNTTSFPPLACSSTSDDFVQIPQRCSVEKSCSKDVEGSAKQRSASALPLSSGADYRESTNAGVLTQSVHNGSRLPDSVNHSKTGSLHGAAPLKGEVEPGRLVTGMWIPASEASVGMENCGRSIQRSVTDNSMPSFSRSTPLPSTMSGESSAVAKKDASTSSCGAGIDAAAESHSTSTVAMLPEKQQVRRGRGRPPGSKNKPKNYPLAFEKLRTRNVSRGVPQRVVRRPGRPRSSYATAQNCSQTVTLEKTKNLAAEGRLSEDPLTSGAYSIWIPPACARVLMENVKITDVTTDAVTITFKESATEAGFFSK